MTQDGPTSQGSSFEGWAADVGEEVSRRAGNMATVAVMGYDSWELRALRGTRVGARVCAVSLREERWASGREVGM